MSRYRVSVSKYLDILCLHPLRAYQCQGVTCDPGQLSSSLETAALGAGAGEAGRRQLGNGSAPSVTIRKHFKRKENICADNVNLSLLAVLYPWIYLFRLDYKAKFLLSICFD